MNFSELLPSGAKTSNRDNIALFFFSGHGFQRSVNEDLVLFEDFGSNVGPSLRGRRLEIANDVVARRG